MNKRGLSGVIAVVLIVLIVLISISIVWLFVQPTITKILKGNFGGGGGGAAKICIEANVVPINCQETETGYKVQV
ncbi:hypothetical protein CO081_04195, partial [Candidatus Pacearchaeota archaeon CG_4_9_14_0_8_um_filter_35_24]